MAGCQERLLARISFPLPVYVRSTNIIHRHTDTYKHLYTQRHKHLNTHTYTPTYTNTYIIAQTHTLKHADAYSHTHIHTNTHPYSLNTHMFTHAYPQIHITLTESY